MRVLIFEPDLGGHHARFVRLMLDAVRPLGVEASLATQPSCVRSEGFRQLLEPGLAGVQVDASVRPSLHSGARAALSLVGELRRVALAARADHVLIPYADGLAQLHTLRELLGRRVLPPGVVTEGLFFRAGPVYAAESRHQTVARRASWEVARRAPYARIHHLDPATYEWVSTNAPREVARWSLMPDPVDISVLRSREEARRKLGLPVAGTCVGCVGVIDERKGADALVRAFSRSRADLLLLAGPHSTGVREAIAALPEQRRRSVWSFDRFVSDEELECAIHAMDLVAALYPRHIGSASVAIRAAAAARPVLGSSYGWIGRTVTQFDLGWITDATEASVLARHLDQSLERATAWRPTPRCQRYVEFNSVSGFQTRWTSLLRERLRLPPLAENTWEWVKTGLA